MALDFDKMSEDDFGTIDDLPRKPAGRNSPPSRFGPLLTGMLASGERKRTKKPLDNRKPPAGGPSAVEQMERELRRAAKQLSAKIIIRKTTDADNENLTHLSFRVEPLPAKTEDKSANGNGGTNGKASEASAKAAATTSQPTSPAAPSPTAQAPAQGREKAKAS